MTYSLSACVATYTAHFQNAVNRSFLHIHEFTKHSLHEYGSQLCQQICTSQHTKNNDGILDQILSSGLAIRREREED